MTIERKLLGTVDATASEAVYIEDVMATHLYTGTGANQTITNGIDLATKGGLVWIKSRTTAGLNTLCDTARGTTKDIYTNNTNAQDTGGNLSSFNLNGFSFSGSSYFTNSSGDTFASWTFRKQAKFFDIVTYTGTGSARTISHALGSAPGMIIVKRTDTTGNWQVYHRSLTSAANSIQLNLSDAQASATTVWNSTAPTSTVFSVGTDATVNASGGTYVAYLFAHNAGGFGPAGTDSVVACGSSSSGTVNLGWEPQFVLFKVSSVANNWKIYDNMRGFSPDGSSKILNPNLSDNEVNDSDVKITSTGFSISIGGATGIYLAIRRGPMKTPTDATKVFSASVAVSGFPAYVTTFPVDFNINGSAAGSDKFYAISRLTGTAWMFTASTAVEASSPSFKWDSNTGCVSAWPAYIGWNFRRAPGFFDVVCYTGTGSAQTVPHNLGVAPKIVIYKKRNAAEGWYVVSENGSSTVWTMLTLNSGAAGSFAGNLSSYNTASSIDVYNAGPGVSGNYVAYLFATCPGVSKVGSYTGNGSSQTIDCGFAAGARFVLIKRTDSTGDWLVADTARGLVSGNDPLLKLNSTAAEVTTLDWIDPYSAGFEVVQESTANANVNGASYVFLAIA